MRVGIMGRPFAVGINAAPLRGRLLQYPWSFSAAGQTPPSGMLSSNHDTRIGQDSLISMRPAGLGQISGDGQQIEHISTGTRRSYERELDTTIFRHRVFAHISAHAETLKR